MTVSGDTPLKEMYPPCTQDHPHGQDRTKEQAEKGACVLPLLQGEMALSSCPLASERQRFSLQTLQLSPAASWDSGCCLRG